MRTFLISIEKKILVKQYVFDMEETCENKVENFLYKQKFLSQKYIHSQSIFLFYNYKIFDCIEASWF